MRFGRTDDPGIVRNERNAFPHTLIGWFTYAVSTDTDFSDMAPL